MNAQAKLQRRMMENKRINDENKALVRRIYDRKSNLLRSDFDKDFKESRQYTKVRQQFRPQKSDFLIALASKQTGQSTSIGEIKLPKIDQNAMKRSQINKSQAGIGSTERAKNDEKPETFRREE